MTVAALTPSSVTETDSAETTANETRTPALADRDQLAATSLQPLGEALQELATLSPGWDGYGALAPTATALERTWYLASMVVENGLPVPQVFPTRNGGIQLEWHTTHATLEWETDPSGATGVFVFDDHRTGEKLDGELPGAISELVEALWRIVRG